MDPYIALAYHLGIDVQRMSPALVRCQSAARATLCAYEICESASLVIGVAMQTTNTDGLRLCSEALLAAARDTAMSLENHQILLDVSQDWVDNDWYRHNVTDRIDLPETNDTEEITSSLVELLNKDAQALKDSASLCTKAACLADIPLWQATQTITRRLKQNIEDQLRGTHIMRRYVQAKSSS